MDHDADLRRQDAGDDEDATQWRVTATAYHEAGHAVMAMFLERSIRKVTIKSGRSPSGENRLGACEVGKGRSKHLIEDEVLILLAGMVAEARFTGQYCEQGAQRDLTDIRRLLLSRGKSVTQCERLERRLLEKAEHILRDQGRAQAIELVARELIAKETISGRAVRHFYSQAARQAF